MKMVKKVITFLIFSELQLKWQISWAHQKDHSSSSRSPLFGNNGWSRDGFCHLWPIVKGAKAASDMDMWSAIPVICKSGWSSDYKRRLSSTFHLILSSFADLPSQQLNCDNLLPQPIGSSWSVLRPSNRCSHGNPFLSISRWCKPRNPSSVQLHRVHGCGRGSCGNYWMRSHLLSQVCGHWRDGQVPEVSGCVHGS